MGMKRLLALTVLLSLAGCSAQAPNQVVEFGQITLTDSEPAPVTTPTNQEVSFVMDASAEIEIEDQRGDGRSVEIEEIRVGREGTFLVIYDGTGLVLATALVSPQSQPVNVELDVILERSQELQAALYLDDGDGEFSIASDSPLVDDEGEIVHEDFDYELVTNG